MQTPHDYGWRAGSELNITESPLLLISPDITSSGTEDLFAFSRTLALQRQHNKMFNKMFKCLIKCLFNIVFATIYFIMIAFISQQGKQEHLLPQ